MVNEKNLLLEYTIDTLLNTFNPGRRPIMRRLHFYKMMDILDTKLQDKEIDIKYPNYWYKYGSVTDFSYLDQIIPNGFSGRYIDNENILFPKSHRRNYDVDPKKQLTINSTINSLCKHYQYKEDYGELLKKESYKLNSPYTFNTTFQEYIKIVVNQGQSTLTPREEILESLLNKLLSEFPEDDFPEILDLNLLWDDTTRLVLDYVEDRWSKDYYLNILMNLFWDSYSKGIRSIFNKYFPSEYVLKWKEEYEISILEVDKKIGELRKGIIVEQKHKFSADNDLVKKLLVKAYDLNV